MNDDEMDLIPPGYSTGLLIRNFEDHPAGFLSYAGLYPPELYYSDDELVDKIKLNKKNDVKASLLDFWEMFISVILDQNGLGYCVDDKTEILTETGWKFWSDYDWKSKPLVATMNPISGNMEFQRPWLKHAYEYNGKMLYSTNRRIDFAVTPDHRMLTRKWDESKRTLSDNFQFQRAADTGWYFGLPHSTRGWVGTELNEVTIEGDRSYNGDDFVKLLAILTSDGFAGGSDSTNNWVSFCCFEPKWQNRISALATRCGFREQESRPGVWRRTDAGALADWIRCHIYAAAPYRASTKRVPGIIKQVSTRQIALFLEYFGDRTHSPKAGEEPHFYSASKRVIDDIQELLLRIGKRGSICERGPRTSEYAGKEIRSGVEHSLIVSSTNRLSIDRKKHLEEESYSGMVYCTTVSNGTLITRRNGSVLISGNCHAFGPTMAVMLLRAKQGLPFVLLSPSSVAGPVTNFTNSGAYIFRDAEHIRKYGICPIEDKGETVYPMTTTEQKWWNPRTQALAAKYKVEEWWDFNVRDERGQFSALADNHPLCPGYNWWGHATCDAFLDYEESSGGKITFYKEGFNSWNSGWKYGKPRFPGMYRFPQGYGRNLATADECWVPRYITPA